MGNIRRQITFMLLLAALAVLAACGGGQAADSADTVTASVLVEPNAQEAQWFRDVEVPEGSNGYELLVAATDGDVGAEWYAEFQSHFVEEILGIAPEGSEFWGVFLWNEERDSWEPLADGADFHSVQDDDVMGWALVEYDPSGGNLPSSRP